MNAFKLSYDYRCPFAKNIHLHAVAALKGGADLQIEFMPWTMSQNYRAEGAPDVWNDEKKDSELLSLAISTSIRDQQPALFLDVHEAFFRARHEQGVRLVSWEQIEPILAPLGVDIEKVKQDVASRRPHQVIGETFTEFTRYEAFGVPTFVVNGDATFVRYMEGPESPQKSGELLTSLVTLMSSQSALNEFKHTRVPN
jgi:protein-disulfide isomerase-like protein with CxxC motif